jgi:hypothetical protein
MNGYFDVKFGNWLPREESPIMVSADGEDVYRGQTLYYLDGTDEYFADRDNCIEYAKKEYYDDFADVEDSDEREELIDEAIRDSIRTMEAE